MLVRIRAELTMQKPLNILARAPIVKALVFPTAYALIVDFMQEKILNSETKTSLPSIGLDLMGSDVDPKFVLDSVLPVLEKLQNSANFVLFGEESVYKDFVSAPHISFQVCPETIAMSEDPLKAIRKKKNSSLSLGIDSLKKNKIQAFISMGNTGALLATARGKLGTLPSITRPALLAVLPTKKKNLAVLDVGANTEYTSSHLLEFAAMGSSYQKVCGIQSPTIGLLNIGTEEIKGPPELQKTYQLLSTLSSRHHYPLFSGNIEGRDALEGNIDVLITGGFAGNIFLKTMEGAAQFFLQALADQTTDLKKKLDYREYSGAVLCGVNGIVIKCHGNAKPKAIEQSLINAIQLIEKKFLDTIKEEIASFFDHGSGFL